MKNHSLLSLPLKQLVSSYSSNDLTGGEAEGTHMVTHQEIKIRKRHCQNQKGPEDAHCHVEETLVGSKGGWWHWASEGPSCLGRGLSPQGFIRIPPILGK